MLFLIKFMLIVCRSQLKVHAIVRYQLRWWIRIWKSRVFFRMITSRALIQLVDGHCWSLFISSPDDWIVRMVTSEVYSCTSELRCLASNKPIWGFLDVRRLEFWDSILTSDTLGASCLSLTYYFVSISVLVKQLSEQDPNMKSDRRSKQQQSWCLTNILTL